MLLREASDIGRIGVIGRERELLINYQLGVIVPEGCGLEVAGETVILREGERYAFNNSYFHRAWNKGKTPRVLFAVYDMHPELTDVERAVLTLLSDREEHGFGYVGNYNREEV